MLGIVGVLGLCPGLVAGLPGEPGRVKRGGLRAWVVGAGWWRLTRAGRLAGAWWCSRCPGGRAPVR